ncbi:hypothetical protein JDF658_15900 [Carboxydocella sp. JDF658]|nr:hypothetical protein ULO1_02000 [Carboxydocella sp. ULO1]GAW31825.1 hypothetical protein JDF658_15900 [Carboxydocella sp. JDF658]
MTVPALFFPYFFISFIRHPMYFRPGCYRRRKDSNIELIAAAIAVNYCYRIIAGIEIRQADLQIVIRPL